MPKASRARYVILPTGHGKPCVHYFVTAADGRRFCAVCGRYRAVLEEAELAEVPSEPAPLPGPTQATS